MHNGARVHHDHGHGWPRWPRVGAVPYQALPLLRFFACKYSRAKKVRKGEGSLGTRLGLICWIITVPCDDHYRPSNATWACDLCTFSSYLMGTTGGIK